MMDKQQLIDHIKTLPDELFASISMDIAHEPEHPSAWDMPIYWIPKREMKITLKIEVEYHVGTP